MDTTLLDAPRLRLLLDEGNLHSAGRCRYQGDQRHIVGEIKGPRTYGGRVAAVTAEYVADEDMTYVAWVVVPDEALQHAQRDQFGVWRLAAVS